MAEARGRAAAWDGVALQVVTIDDSSPVEVHRLVLGADEWTSASPGLGSGLSFNSDNVVWTGVGFAIVSHRDSGAMYRSDAEEWTTVPPSGSALGLPAIWTGAGVADGERFYDPASGAWSDLGSPPGPYRERPTAVWTGDDYLIWRGNACGPGADCVTLVDPVVGLAWRPSADGVGPHQAPPARRAISPARALKVVAMVSP